MSDCMCDTCTLKRKATMGKEVYLIQQPKRLESLAIENLAAGVAAQADALIHALHRLRHQGSGAAAGPTLSWHTETLRLRLQQGVPRTVFNTFAEEMMRAFIRLYDRQKPEECIATFKKFSIARMLEILFSRNLSYWEIPYYRFIRCSNFHSGLRLKYRTELLTGLTGLRLTKCAAGLEDHYIQLVEKLPRLTYLAIGTICTCQMVACIARSCPLIEELDLSYTSVRGDCVESLLTLRHLRIIRLERANFTTEGFKRLLLSCPNIEYIDGCDLADVLQHIAASEDYKGQQFGLTNCKAHKKSLLDLQRVVSMCPRLREVVLNRQILQDNVIALTGCKELHKLTLLLYDFYKDRVRETLQEIGHNLTELNLSGVAHVDKGALYFINQTCPNLKTLELNNCNVFTDKLCELCLTHEPSSFRYGNTKPVTELFKNVTNINFTFWKYLKSHVQLNEYRSIVLELMSIVLSHCVNVEFIVIRTNIALPEDAMLQCVRNNRMERLQSLTFEGGMISGAAAERLVQACAHSPTVRCILR